MEPGYDKARYSPTSCEALERRLAYSVVVIIVANEMNVT